MGTTVQIVTRSTDGLTVNQPGSERRSDIGQKRHQGSSVRRLDGRYVARSIARRVMLTLTVDESEWTRARTTVMRAAGADVELLRVAPVAGTAQLRLHIGLESHALDDTMRRIMRSLNAAEFGPVVAIRHRNSSAQSTTSAH
ncbi:MAG TPA: hypothetical protein VMH32_05185 [Burkholderiales bacterium]|nr:hypothetical protein [Burkholderiales bacterium]